MPPLVPKSQMASGMGLPPFRCRAWSAFLRASPSHTQIYASYEGGIAACLNTRRYASRGCTRISGALAVSLGCTGRFTPGMVGSPQLGVAVSTASWKSQQPARRLRERKEGDCAWHVHETIGFRRWWHWFRPVSHWPPPRTLPGWASSETRTGGGGTPAAADGHDAVARLWEGQSEKLKTLDVSIYRIDNDAAWAT